MLALIPLIAQLIPSIVGLIKKAEKGRPESKSGPKKMEDVLTAARPLLGQLLKSLNLPAELRNAIIKFGLPLLSEVLVQRENESQIAVGDIQNWEIQGGSLNIKRTS